MQKPHAVTSGAPRPGDVLLRGDATSGFYLVDAISLQEIAGPLSTMAAAIESACFHGAAAIWQQLLDNRGRPLGDPIRLPFRSARPVLSR